MITEIITQIGPEFIAAAIAILFFRYFNTGYKLIGIDMIVSFIVELAGFIFGERNVSCQWLYNYYLLVDFGLLLIAAYYLSNKKIKFPLLLGGYLFLVASWVHDVYHGGMDMFTEKAYITGSVLVVFAYLFVLYHAIMTHRGKIAALPAFWLCIGIVLFYGCNMPHFSVLGYLSKICSDQSNRPLFIILVILSNIQCVFTTVSFYLYYRHHKKLLIKSAY